MQKFVLSLFLAFGVLVVQGAPVQAGEIDVLLDVLVEEGILSPAKAQIVRDETKRRVAKELAEAKSYAVPGWAQKIKFKGDLRLRHQYERRTNDTEGRNRGRIRYRLGIEATPMDNLKVAAGLASGSDDPRSTNQTLQNTFDTPDIRLDLAYAEYEPMSGVKVVGGKFKRKEYLWVPADLLWDGDINPEGGSAHLEHSLSGNLDSFINTGVWILDTNDQVDRPDPFLTYVQGGLKWQDGNYDAKLAAIHYGFHGIKGLALDNAAGTNTSVGGVLKYDYDSVGTSVEVGVQKLFGGLPCHIDERIAFFSDYIHNFDPSDENNGWALGVKFGNKKVKEKGQWQAKYIFANLQRDAFPDTFPDSDRYGGGTDVRGHEGILEYALKENVILGLDYYQTDRISAASNREHLIQSDLQLKF